MEGLSDREQLIWLAGFFDGEGCIQCPRGLVPLRVTVAQINAEPLNVFRRIFGGNVYREPKPGYRDMHLWAITGRAAVDALLKLRPFLTIKAEEADLGVRYGLTFGTREKPLRVTDAVRHQRVEMHQQITALKRRAYPA